MLSASIGRPNPRWIDTGYRTTVERTLDDATSVVTQQNVWDRLAVLEDRSVYGEREITQARIIHASHGAPVCDGKESFEYIQVIDIEAAFEERPE